MRTLIKLDEPKLLFGYNQMMDDPRDGLALFGPLDEGKTYGIRSGIIGTIDGINRFKKWIYKIQRPISNDPPQIARPPFPGFEAVFQIPWNPEPILEIPISKEELSQSIFLDDKYQRVYKTVDSYTRRIINVLKEEETSIDIWFVIVPDELYKYCRPQSIVEPRVKIYSNSKQPVKHAKFLLKNPGLFQDINDAAIPYHYEVNFHNQLKARLLGYNIPVQIIRESTIAYNDFTNSFGEPLRNLKELESTIAWHLSTAVFYKVGGRPWKVGNIRKGVCYIGLVFKKDDKSAESRTACCAAQMFLDSGDGVVFKGAIGPWYNPLQGDFHLTREAAKELVDLAIKSYIEKMGEPPSELFLHGKVKFNYYEWQGFKEASPAQTNLVGIRITDGKDLRLYRKGKLPILRGLAFVQNEHTAYLWTKGYTPRLQTYPGREVPLPLQIDICHGNASIETVLNDIMFLTKLNYNACVFSSGQPVTLKFANAVGEILTAGPIETIPPLPFKFYI